MNSQVSSYEPAQPAESLFDLLGGRAAIAAVIERLYKHILNDEDLRPYFARADMTRLKSQQVDFFTALTGGPAQYRGAPLKQAHAHVPVSGAQFDRVAGHLATAMRELGVSQPLIDATLAALAPARRAVVNTADAPGAEGPPGSGPSQRLSRPPEEPRGSRPPLSIEAPPAGTPAASVSSASSASAASSVSAASAASSVSAVSSPSASAGPSAGSAATLAGQPAAAVSADPLSDLRFLRAALDNMPTPVLLADPSLQVIYANDRAVRAIDQQGEGFRLAIGAGASLSRASVAAFCGDPAAAAQAFAATSLPWEMRVAVGGSPLQVRVNGVFDSGNALLGYVVQWEAVTEPAEELSAEPGEEPMAEPMAGPFAEPFVAEPVAARVAQPERTPAPAPQGPGTHVTLTVNGSTMTLVLGEGELNVQYVPPTHNGAPPRAVGLRIGPPSA